MLPTRCAYGVALFAVFLLIPFPRAGAQTNALLPAQQLDDLVAPVALYPDSLVSLNQKPGAAFALVDPDLNQTGGGDIVEFRAECREQLPAVIKMRIIKNTVPIF